MTKRPESSISFFDTASRDTVNLELAAGQKIGVYTCGPTVYKYAHIGNMRPYVTADVLRRTVESAGGVIKQVINITDVGHLTSDADTGEDKIAQSAREEGLSAWDIANHYEEAYWQDAEALLIRRPEVVAHATEHIEDQILLIAELERRGFTYETSDGVYFDSSRFPDYAEFARLELEGLKFGQRVEAGEKRNPTDFALWKFPQKEGIREMEWDSPWGIGFPGWHIECSAMAMRYLGSSFDIHTGGIDHIPVHHTNEIAQAKAAGNDFARYWLHTNFLVDAKGHKMSKSSGESLRLPDVVNQYGVSPSAVRYMYLTQHYRSELELSPDRINQAMTTLSRLYDTAAILKQRKQTDVSQLNQTFSDEGVAFWIDFQNKLRSDFDTPGALNTLQRMVRAKSLSAEEKYRLLIDMDNTLGLGIKETVEDIDISPAQQLLLNKRSLSRSNRDFIAADNLRDELKSQGIVAIDTPGGQQIVRKI